jgi:hypothetical protein
MKQKTQGYWPSQQLVERIDKEYEKGWYVHQVIGPMVGGKHREFIVIYRKDEE